MRFMGWSMRSWVRTGSGRQQTEFWDRGVGSALSHGRWDLESSRRARHPCHPADFAHSRHRDAVCQSRPLFCRSATPALTIHSLRPPFSPVVSIVHAIDCVYGEGRPNQLHRNRGPRPRCARHRPHRPIPHTCRATDNVHPQTAPTHAAPHRTRSPTHAGASRTSHRHTVTGRAGIRTHSSSEPDSPYPPPSNTTHRPPPRRQLFIAHPFRVEHHPPLRSA